MTKIIVANWKMNPQSQKEAEILFNKFLKNIKKIKDFKIVICPPFPYLYINKKLKNKRFILGAQNVSENVEASSTGEVSAEMLSDFGIKYVIVGHSECRKMGESDVVINKKILNLIKQKINPIICIGERERDMEGGYLSFIENQIKDDFQNVPKSQLGNIIIAYEPIWAIGKDAIREATKEEFVEVKIFIRKILTDIYDSKSAQLVPIIYGGSVNSSNSKYFIVEGEADGLLVGRDSLNVKKFSDILDTLK